MPFSIKDLATVCQQQNVLNLRVRQFVEDMGKLLWKLAVLYMPIVFLGYHSASPIPVPLLDGSSFVNSPFGNS